MNMYALGRIYSEMRSSKETGALPPSLKFQQALLDYLRSHEALLPFNILKLTCRESQYNTLRMYGIEGFSYYQIMFLLTASCPTGYYESSELFRLNKQQLWRVLVDQFNRLYTAEKLYGAINR